MRRVRTRDRGFSLIELMIVIVLIALVSALSYPSIMHTMAEQRLHEGARQAVDLLQYARFQAVLRGRAQVVTMVLTDELPGGSMHVAESNSGACNDELSAAKREFFLPTPDEGGDVGVVLAVPSGIGNAGICFKPNGKVYEAASALPPRLDTDEKRAFNVPRSGNVGLRFKRFQGRDGALREAGVRKEVLLSHLGIARFNTELSAEPE